VLIPSGKERIGVKGAKFICWEIIVIYVVILAEILALLISAPYLDKNWILFIG